ncbi:Protein CBG21073 [Caenorhabditis briggsae]|uniref:Protein CBG21073 n=1 Tax=Caenorhabditis briggsae TaxID=6238 RepID=A8XZ94_CAEBR|nr:Protein CBG21073 [Caenorhabditis briggsae]CAP37961.2 Protein CBG21073 [Caenorhabditis briggsae]
MLLRMVWRSCADPEVLQHFIVEHMDLKVEDKDERCSEDCFRKEGSGSEVLLYVAKAFLNDLLLRSETLITGFCERELIEKLMEYSTQPDGRLYTEEQQERPSGIQKSANQIPMSRLFHIAHARSTAKDDRAIGRDQCEENKYVTMRIVIAVQILVTIIVCPKSCALKKAGCKNQVFEEYRQLRGKRFFAKSSEDKGTGQNEFIIPYNGEIIISIPELQIRIQGKW